MRLQGVIFITLLISTSCSVDVSENQPISTSCPERCECSLERFSAFNGRLQTVNCTRKGLYSFPDNIPKETEALILVENKFQNLSNLPVLPHLKLLDLSYNRIVLLNNQRIYDNIGRLQHLCLRGNAIKILLHGSFSGLKYLDVLDLSHNAIQTVEIHAFGGLNHLQKLYLDHNYLRQLKKIWLQAIPSITELYLAGNFIYSLAKEVFKPLSQLLHLDLSGNSITKVDISAFQGLHNLKVLNLSKNKLKDIPPSILSVPDLHILLLDFNKMKRIKSNAFLNSNISEISLCFLPNLRVVEKGAFTNLPRLVTLQVHDNQQLIFIHPKAFINTPHIVHLFIHNNALMALPMTIKQSLRELTDLHLYNNPLHCDCNIYWIKHEIITLAKHNATDRSYIKFSDKLLCDSPTSKIKVPLWKIPLADIPPLCPPTSLALFSDSVNVTIGDDLYLECQAIGVPEPDIYWLFPYGEVHNSSTDNTRVIIKDDRAIFINGVRESDEGTYGCESRNQMGYDISSTRVQVVQKDLKIVPLTISTNFITIEWRGSIPILHLKDFQLLYRESSSSHSQTVYLSSEIHRCTISGLQPLTKYEFCITYMHVYIVHCVNITTELETTVKQGITTATSSKIIVGVVTVFGVTFVVGFAILGVKNVWKRKGYTEPPSKKGEINTQIPLENLSQPSNSFLCSSRTALLPNSQI